jgi:agmatinase
MLTMGGDHFVSLPLLRAHAKKHGPLSLVHFDAHSDTWRDENYNHGTMFFHAIEEGLIDPKRSIHVGLRTYNPEDHGFTILEVPWVHEHGVAATIAEIERVTGGHKAYLTFDIDCLDPSYAPGTGTPVVGGLSTHQATAIMHGLGNMNFVAMDLVEVAPIYDIGEITALAGATLMLDFLCLRAADMEPVKQPDKAG